MAKIVTLLSLNKSFVTSQAKAGATGLQLVLQDLEHMQKHNDWTPLAWLLAKSDLKDARIFRAIVGAVTHGLSMDSTSKEAKAQPTGLVIKRAKEWGFTNKFAMLAECVNDGLSFRSAETHERLLGKEKDDTITLEKVVRSYRTFLKRLEKGHISLEQVLRLIDAQDKVNADLDAPVIQPVKEAA